MTHRQIAQTGKFDRPQNGRLVYSRRRNKGSAFCVGDHTCPVCHAVKRIPRLPSLLFLFPLLFCHLLILLSSLHTFPPSIHIYRIRNSFPAIFSSDPCISYLLNDYSGLPVTMRLSLAGAAIGLLSYSAGVAAQTFSDCNPLKKSMSLFSWTYY